MSVNKNLYSVMNQVEEQKQTLWNAWIKDEDFESRLRLAIQEVEAEKLEHPELNISAAYQQGRLEGYVELFEQLFREREQERAIESTPEVQTEIGHQILDALYRSGEKCLLDLADDAAISYSALTEVMARMLLCGIVESTRSGRNTRCRLTDTGRRYYEKRFVRET